MTYCKYFVVSMMCLLTASTIALVAKNSMAKEIFFGLILLIATTISALDRKHTHSQITFFLSVAIIIVITYFTLHSYYQRSIEQRESRNRAKRELVEEVDFLVDRVNKIRQDLPEEVIEEERKAYQDIIEQKKQRISELELEIERRW